MISNLLLLLACIISTAESDPYSLPLIFSNDAGETSLLLVPIDPHDPAPANAQLSSVFPSNSGNEVLDSATARLAARRDACHSSNSPVFSSIPVSATNSYHVASQPTPGPRSRRGDAGYLLRPMRGFEDFYELAKDMGLNGVYAEVGVCDGKSSMRWLSKFPMSKMLLVDSWDAVDAYTAEDGERNLQTTLQNLAPFPQDKYEILRMTSLEAAALVPDGALDFIYIDAGHSYADVRADLEAWWPKLKLGGILAGDDYYNGYVPAAGYTFGVKDAADEFFASINHRLYLTGFADPRESVFQTYYALKCL
ncbi:hypothetical protein TrCOL_g8310 [Triparma columacea]|uniref:Class I SAM-dependent methyltransferase n=1 Tax=Triparma columacea TaxID=722753 RepID=A0A9W7GHX6_9STRA|nr:hypothetical protein TrCOL_g8310 [Triparma columacea]